MKFEKKSSTAFCRARPIQSALLPQDAHDTLHCHMRSSEHRSPVRAGLIRFAQGAVVASCFSMAAYAQSTTTPDTPRYPTAGPDTSTVTRRTTTDVFVETAPNTYTVVRGELFDRVAANLDLFVRGEVPSDIVDAAAGY